MSSKDVSVATKMPAMGKAPLIKKSVAVTIGIYILLIVAASVMFVPFVWMTLTAFKTIGEATSVNPFVIFPSEWRLDAFRGVTEQFNFLQIYSNTLQLIFWRIFAALVTASAAGYAFARLNFKGRDILFAAVLLQMMVPSQIFVIPQYLMVVRLGMLNTIFGLVFPGLVSAFGTFFMRQSFKSMPRELEEAARVDGCNIGQTFLLVMLPLAKPALAALGIFTTIFAFRELLWPVVIATRRESMIISVALARIQGQFEANFPQLMAASLIATVPIIIIYILFQRHFVEGVATTGIKL